MGFQITGDPAADKVLDDSAFALLVGMMLDQQYPMEHVFRGPAKVLERVQVARHRLAGRGRDARRCTRARV